MHAPRAARQHHFLQKVTIKFSRFNRKFNFHQTFRHRHDRANFFEAPVNERHSTPFNYLVALLQTALLRWTTCIEWSNAARVECDIMKILIKFPIKVFRFGEVKWANLLACCMLLLNIVQKAFTHLAQSKQHTQTTCHPRPFFHPRLSSRILVLCGCYDDAEWIEQ